MIELAQFIASVSGSSHFLPGFLPNRVKAMVNKDNVFQLV